MTPRFDDRPRVYSYGAGVQSTAMLAPGWNEDEGYRCGDVCDT